MPTQNLQFDDAIDQLYRRHDGGQDTRKGVTRVTEFSDYGDIPDTQAAALMVYLDIFRGVPQENGSFRFGAEELLAESAFERMLQRTLGTDMDQVKEIQRSQGGISYGEALAQVVPLLGSTTLAGDHPAEAPLTRALAVELMAKALETADGTGKLPHLYYVPEDTTLTELELPANTVVASPDGTLVTLTQDGVFMPLASGYHYAGDIRLTLTERYELYRYTTEPMKPGAMPDEPSDLPPEPALWNYF
jgi:hypothetical protein